MNASKAAFVFLVACALPATAAAESSFRDVTTEVGIDFKRAHSASFSALERLREASRVTPVPMTEFPNLPGAPRGLPGVSILDFDLDGDLDVFATNGPGADNALYENRLVPTRKLFFVDVGASAGVGATDMDANGTCHGDLDNDGDPDLLVLGRSEGNRLFRNLGNGRFERVVGSGLDRDRRNHMSCSMGDVDGDGLLDIVVANTFDFATSLGIFVVPFELNEHNQLYLNQGGLTFSDESEARGLEQLDLIPAGAATITWAIAVVDVDLDGDQDIVFADDNGALPTTKYDPAHGVNRGMIQVLHNDGTGHFTAVAQATRPESPGAWMSLAFGDLDHDGHMDIFGSNFGDYGVPSINPAIPYALGDQSSRWLLGDGRGGFDDPMAGVGPASSFGWGSAIFDLENDGDSDIVYFGGMDMGAMAIADNPGIVFRNVGKRSEHGFVLDLEALGLRHLNRGVEGAAIGDLDRDGFVDIATAAGWVAPEGSPRVPSPAKYAAPLDGIAGIVPMFAPDGEGGMVWTGRDLAPGDLRIERNETRGRPGITVRALGAVGLLKRGRVNRSGVGAVVTFRPQGGQRAMMPITAGSSHVSAHAAEAYFGLGRADRGTVEVLWPGGARTRLYGVTAGEQVVMPETGCSYDAPTSALGYEICVWSALIELAKRGAIEPAEALRHYLSALIARDRR